VRRIADQDQAIEETPPGAGALAQQAVHRRRQPDHAQDFGERRLARGRGAVDPDRAPLALAVLEPGGDEIDHPAGSADARADRPGAAADPVELPEPRPPQPATRAQERDRLQKVGLAGAVGPGQDHRPRVDLEIQPKIRSEIAQAQPAQRGGSGSHDWKRPASRTVHRVERERHQTRIGIST
jgi:hypothetical protein